MMEKGDCEEGVVIKSFLDRKTYVIKEIMIGGAKLEDRETGAEIKVGISALKLFFEFAEERR